MALLRFKKKPDSLELHPSIAVEPKDPFEIDRDESNWLVSYADMMTLLCGFFIMLFSMAKLDEPQFEKVKESVAKQFGGDYKSPNKDLAKFITQIIQEAGIDSETTVRTSPSGVAITFTSSVFFETLSADVNPKGQEILNKLIKGVLSRQEAELKEYKVVVEGHTDSRPILGGPFPSNWELSSARASRVLRLFLNTGFHPNQLTAIGYGDTRPTVKEERLPDGTWDESILGKNRRVVLRILEPKVDSIPFPETETGPEAPANSTH